VSGLNFNYVVTQDECAAELYIDRGKGADAENKSIFDQLFAHKAEIDTAFGATLSWERLEEKRACRIRHTNPGGGYRSPEDQWPTVQDAIVKEMDKLEKALRPYLKQLKLNG
jgi:hypothetical protein